MTGKRFGRWLVLGIGEIIRLPRGYLRKWKCRCDCGTVKNVNGASLRFGTSQSCGCLTAESVGRRARVMFTKHGMTETPTWIAWRNMILRCTCEKHEKFKHYGGRGISICERWLESFKNFYDDMGERPKGMTLNRIDNNGNYCKENCEWADQKTQMRNTRKTVYLTLNGTTRPLQVWAEILHVKRRTLQFRKDADWTDTEIITTPIRKMTYAHRCQN